MSPLIAPTRGQQLRSWISDVARKWSWRHSALALSVGTLCLIYEGAFLQPEGERQNLFVSWLWNLGQFAFPFVFAAQVADRAIDNGLNLILVCTLAALTVVIGGASAGALLPLAWSGKGALDQQLALYLVLTLVLPYWLGLAGYLHWQQARRALGRVRACEIERTHQQQLIQSARLLALQARVEPQLLFETLRRINLLIDTSVVAADELLADLIAMLRAMLPAANASASTVGREIALVQAYARVTGAPLLQSSQLLLKATPAAAHARLAPMILLPTLRELTGLSPIGWQLQAARDADTLRLSIVAVPPSGEAANAALQALDQIALGERLAAAHGDEAVLRIQPGPEPGLFIELPFHDDQSPDR